MAAFGNASAAMAVGGADLNSMAGREFAYSEIDFQTLVEAAYQHAGIALSDSKRNLIYSRLSRRLRTLGLRSFRNYCEFLAANPSEIKSFINAISTNHTKFFREEHHFEHFRANVAAPLAREAGRAGHRLRIWSAGCSTGEEPYTIAVVLAREIRNFGRLDVRILATDIDTDVLAKAARGEYAATGIEEVPKDYRSLFSRKAGQDGSGRMQIDEEVKALIVFRHLNLMDEWPFRGLFDAIFCRNVMIYFDAPTKSALVDRFTRQLKPGGWLYLGHSESLMGSQSGLQLVGRTTYRRSA